MPWVPLQTEKEGQVLPQVVRVETKFMQALGSGPHQFKTVVRAVCLQLGARLGVPLTSVMRK